MNWLRSRTTVEEIVNDRSLNDLIKYAMLIERDVYKARNTAELKRCTELTDMLFPIFSHLERAPYWLNRLHTRIVTRHCELLGRQHADA